MTRTVVLTGSRGSLASALQQGLPASEYHIRRVSRTAGDGHVGQEALFSPHFLDDVDCIVHLAWSTVPFTAEQNVGQEWRTDLPFLVDLLSAVVKAGRSKGVQFIFLSTCAVYGDSDGPPATERDPLRARGWYTEGKIAGEQIINAFAKRGASSATILRVTNAYGFQPAVYRPQGIIPVMVDAALHSKQVAIWGDGSARKDYLHHSDFVSAVDAVIRARAFGTYNVASGASVSVNDIVAHVERFTGKQVCLVKNPPFAWDVSNTLVDYGKLAAATGWAPRVDIEEGIRRAVEIAKKR